MTTNSIYYHCSPIERREQIKRKGLMPGSWSRARDWRPPYICLSPSLKGSWSLSGGMRYDEDVVVWDMWEVWIGDRTRVKELHYDSGSVKEIRVYERIYKRNVWHIGSREAMI